MAANTKIEWCQHTFNPWIGCTKVAAGCANCYAEAMMDHRLGKVPWGPQGSRQKTSVSNWQQPLKWNREAEQAGERRRVFCASLADVFEDWQGPITDHRGQQLSNATIETAGPGAGPLTMADLRRDLFELIDATPNLDWMLLTKRPENIRCMIGQARLRPEQTTIGEVLEACLPLKNVWLYTSVSEQESADRNIPLLLECRDLVPVLAVSAEPLLGEINLTKIGETTSGIRRPSDRVLRPLLRYDALAGCEYPQILSPYEIKYGKLDHVIVGGESGPQSRPCNVAWIRSLITQCKAAKVPCFVKQLGGQVVWEAGWPTLKHPKGGDMAEWPQDLRVREMPSLLALPAPAK